MPRRSPRPENAPPLSVRREVAAALEAWGTAFASRRIEDLLDLYAEDAVLWGTLSAELREDPAAIRAYFEPVFAFEERQVDFDVPAIRVFGETAVATGTYRFSWKRDGRPERTAARYSTTWRRRAGRWLLVDHHSSVLPAPTLTCIGTIRTPWDRLEDCPRNVDPEGPICKIDLDPAFAAGMKGLEDCPEVLVLYWLGEARRDLLVQPRRDDGRPAGVFALRTPNRPNPIGAATVPLLEVTGSSLLVRGLDCLDGTLLLDLKPSMLRHRS